MAVFFPQHQGEVSGYLVEDLLYGCIGAAYGNAAVDSGPDTYFDARPFCNCLEELAQISFAGFKRDPAGIKIQAESTLCAGRRSNLRGPRSDEFRINRGGFRISKSNTMPAQYRPLRRFPEILRSMSTDHPPEINPDNSADRRTC